jgi:N-acetylmuramoyl-L-alanine amidase
MSFKAQRNPGPRVFPLRPMRDRPRGRAQHRSLAVLAGLLIQCADPPLAPAGAADSSQLPMDADLYAFSAHELERMFASLAQRPANHGQGVVAADAIRLARAHARVSGSCGLCARVRSFVESALSTPDARACDTGLAYAQLLAKEGNAPGHALAAARSVLEHARRWPDAGRCISEARRTQTLLLPADQEVARAPADASVKGESAAMIDPAEFVAARASGRRVALEQIRVYGAGEREVRVVLGLDGPALFRRGEIAAEAPLPRRIFLDLDGVALAPGAHAVLPVAAGGVQRVRAFVLDAATTRVSFDIAEDASYHVFFLTDPYRVILDFRAQQNVASEAARVRTLVLDPGHGGMQSGAHGPNGVDEASVALSLALRVRRLLARALPDVRVVLTRESDRAVSLEERSAIANAVDAELFVSIHLNASASASDKGGVSTYVLDTSDDAQALRLAARENGAQERDVTDLQKLFAGLYRRDQVGHSLELAQFVHAATLRAGRRRLPKLADRGVKRAMFYVLVGARMPAVLCEASFITRPEEAAALKTDAYRQALAEGIAEGIAAYGRGHAR